MSREAFRPARFFRFVAFAIFVIVQVPLGLAAIVVTPASIDFGVRPGSPFGDQPLTDALVVGLVGVTVNGTLRDSIDVDVRNTGPGPVTLRAIDVSGASSFQQCPDIIGGTGTSVCRRVVVTHVCGNMFYDDGSLATIFPLVLDAGASCRLTLHYLQTGLGDLRGALTVVSDATISPIVVPIEAVRTTNVFWSVPVTDRARATASIDGPRGCGFTQAQWLPPPGSSQSPPTLEGYVFPHGLFGFEARPCPVGGTRSVQLDFAQSLPPGTRYLKFGPTPDNAVAHWYEVPSTVDGNSIRFDVTDGGQGDDDLRADGVVVHRGGPALPVATADVPALSPAFALALLLSMLGLGAFVIARRSDRRRSKRVSEQRDRAAAR